MNKTDKQVTYVRANILGLEISHRLGKYYVEKDNRILRHGDFKIVDAYIDGIYDAVRGELSKHFNNLGA